MDRALRWAARARADLRSSAEYIRRDSPGAAAAFLSDVFSAARSLPSNPLRGRVVPEISDPEIREIFVGRFRLLYEVHPGEIWVLRIVHGSRDLFRALGRNREDAREQ